MNVKSSGLYNILIIGTGGTGSHLTSFLAHLIGNDKKAKNDVRITLIDGDIVEEKNLRTQKFLSEDVNKYKAEVLADRYASVFDFPVRYVNNYIENEEQLRKMLRDYELNIIVSCVDNNSARRIIDTMFDEDEEHHLIYIDTGNSSGQGELTGQTVVGYSEMGKKLLPSVGQVFPQIYDEDEDDDENLSCAERIARNIQNIGANISSATTVFNILNNILFFGTIPTNMCMFNATTIETNNVLAA